MPDAHSPLRNIQPKQILRCEREWTISITNISAETARNEANALKRKLLLSSQPSLAKVMQEQEDESQQDSVAVSDKSKFFNAIASLDGTQKSELKELMVKARQEMQSGTLNADDLAKSASEGLTQALAAQGIDLSDMLSTFGEYTKAERRSTDYGALLKKRSMEHHHRQQAQDSTQGGAAAQSVFDLLRSTSGVSGTSGSSAIAAAGKIDDEE